MSTLINDSFKKATIPLNLSASGPIGTAAVTVDIASTFNITATTPGLAFTLPTPTDVTSGDDIIINNIGSTNDFSINGVNVKAGSRQNISWTGTAFTSAPTPVFSGDTVAMTPHNSGPETVVAFDGFELKWHASSATGYDGIAIRHTTATKSLRYTLTDFYLANAAADSSKALWGSNNAWYNLPNLGTVASVINTTYPYAQNVSSTFIGMGNPAMPNADKRDYILYNDTDKVTYKITVDKQASTGEVLSAQNGTCFIEVKKVGISTNQILTQGNGMVIANNQIALDPNNVKKIMLNYASVTASIGDFQATPTLTLSNNIASITNVSGAASAVAIYQVNFTTALPSSDYLVQYEYVANASESAAANATVLPLETSTKTTTGFRFIIRESASTAQNFSIKFVIQHEVNAYITSSNQALVRVLTNPGGASYTQVQLQALYDGQAGINALDTVPQSIIDAANLLAVSTYKLYLGHNIWWYTNTATGATAANWTQFGGGKSAFATSASTIYTLK